MKNASLATGLSMRSMDLDNIIEEDDDCLTWFMEFQRLMAAMAEGAAYKPTQQIGKIDNELACQIKEFYETVEIPDWNIEEVPFTGMACGFYFEDFFDFWFAYDESIGSNKYSFNADTIVVGIEQMRWRPTDKEPPYEELVALTKKQNKSFSTIYDNGVKVLEHCNRPDLVRYFKDNMRKSIIRHYSMYEKEENEFEKNVYENYR